jgi:hypothetical protein
MTTFPLTLGPVESPATCRILGMSSNVPSLGMPSASCWLRACSLCLATDDILLVLSEGLSLARMRMRRLRRRLMEKSVATYFGLVFLGDGERLRGNDSQ